MDVEDLVTFCYFQSPFPSDNACSATFFSSINYLAETPSIASLASLAKPLASSIFLTSSPYLFLKYPFNVYFEVGDTNTYTSLCRKEDSSTDRIALTLFLDSPSIFIFISTC